MLRFPHRRAPWLTARHLVFNTLPAAIPEGRAFRAVIRYF